MLSDVRSCGHHFVHCLVRCTPYIRIAELLWQQLGEVVKVLATQVVRQLEGKRLDLFELRFVECKVHSPLFPPFVIISGLSQNRLWLSAARIIFVPVARKVKML